MGLNGKRPSSISQDCTKKNNFQASWKFIIYLGPITIDYLAIGHAETSVPHALCHRPGAAGSNGSVARSKYGTDLLWEYYLSVGGHKRS